jgi:hypothetical protein
VSKRLGIVSSEGRQVAWHPAGHLANSGQDAGVDVKDNTGKVTTWGFSNAPPGTLLRRGITKDALTNAFTATEGAK